MRQFVLAALLSLFALQAEAGRVEVRFFETSEGVAYEGAGSIMLGDAIATPVAGFIPGTATIVDLAFISVGSVGSIDFYEILNSILDFNLPCGTCDAAGIAFGENFGVTDGDLVALPSGYASGDPLAFSGLFPGQSFASLELEPGIYTSRTELNTIVQGVGSIPLPGAAGLLVAALAGLGLVGRCRRRAALPV